jgi:hypothetical protein
MRTTLDIEDALLRKLKEKAAREGLTLQRLANDLLRQALARGRESGTYSLELEGWEAEQQPGVDVLDRDKLWDLMG